MQKMDAAADAGDRYTSHWVAGGVSTNYAALACVDFPTCHGTWKPITDFVHGFHFLRELGMTADGAPLSNDARS